MTAAELRMARAALGLTQQQMAEALGLSRRHLARLERGYPISATVALAVEALIRQAGFDPESVRCWKGPVANPQELVSNLIAPGDDVEAAVARWRGHTRDAVQGVLALYDAVRDGCYPAAARLLADLDVGPLLDTAGGDDSYAEHLEQVPLDQAGAAWWLVERSVDAALGGRPISQRAWLAVRDVLAEHLGPWMR